jgi:hypothetical protein
MHGASHNALPAHRENGALRSRVTVIIRTISGVVDLRIRGFVL